MFTKDEVSRLIEKFTDEFSEGVTSKVTARFFPELDKHLNLLAALPPAPPQVQYRTRKETAGILHCSLPTLDSYEKQNKINSYRIGRRKMYKLHEIENALKLIRYK